MAMGCLGAPTGDGFPAIAPKTMLDRCKRLLQQEEAEKGSSTTICTQQHWTVVSSARVRGQRLLLATGRAARSRFPGRDGRSCASAAAEGDCFARGLGRVVAGPPKHVLVLFDNFLGHAIENLVDAKTRSRAGYEVLTMGEAFCQ